MCQRAGSVLCAVRLRPACQIASFLRRCTRCIAYGIHTDTLP
uniref:Late expression factor 5 n=1 Tax=Ackermannviridae sp. TaxID=2831612 RepID=A0A8S5VXE7_9CAUD|nr:MAG TPA: late expression factor 5 [Ackermannviridae sp.]